jgi:hypothetical protein
LANAFNQEIVSYSRIGGAAGLLICVILFSFPAAAEVYPVSGVWIAIDTDFPSAANETCLAVKTFGVEAVSKKSISEMIIFAKDKRYDLKGDVQTETTLKTIKAIDGAYQITETLQKSHGWIGIRRKTEYDLRINDPQTIEIWDGKNLTRYTKCAGTQKVPV